MRPGIKRLIGLDSPGSAAAVLACLALLGPALPHFELLRMNQHLLLAVNVLALNFCLGLGGQASLAQGAFCGLGAYASVILHQQYPEASLVIVPITALAAFAVGFAVSYPMEKLGEGFLAMATLGVSLIFSNLATSLVSLTGGPDGMVVYEKLGIFGRALSGDGVFYALFLGLISVTLLLFHLLRDSRHGRALLACKADSEAAAACGIARARTRSLAFGIGAAASSLGGVLYAHYSGFVSPGEFSLELSLKSLLYLVIGGPGRLVGPLVAVLILESLLSHAQFLGDGRILFHGLLLGAALVLPSLARRMRRTPGS